MTIEQLNEGIEIKRMISTLEGIRAEIHKAIENLRNLDGRRTMYIKLGDPIGEFVTVFQTPLEVRYVALVELLEREERIVTTDIQDLRTKLEKL